MRVSFGFVPKGPVVSKFAVFIFSIVVFSGKYYSNMKQQKLICLGMGYLFHKENNIKATKNRSSTHFMGASTVCFSIRPPHVWCVKVRSMWNFFQLSLQAHARNALGTKRPQSNAIQKKNRNKTAILFSEVTIYFGLICKQNQAAQNGGLNRLVHGIFPSHRRCVFRVCGCN